jgi:crotonobetainyl-CoA:carnitine CoA-transferase CaiB-like acyl-CoA transferase
VPVADVGGAMYAYSSVLAALYERERTGRGAAISVALFDAATEWMGYPLHYTMGSGIEQEPVGVGSPAVAPYASFVTSDGETIVLGTTNDAEWQRLATIALERPDLAADPAYAGNAQRVARRGELDPAIADWASGLTAAQIEVKLDAAGIGHAKLNGVQDLIDHPQLSERGRWTRVDSPVGELDAVLPPPISPSWEFRLGGVPALGEHTDAVLGWLGLDNERIGALHLDGVV